MDYHVLQQQLDEDDVAVQSLPEKEKQLHLAEDEIVSCSFVSIPLAFFATLEDYTLHDSDGAKTRIPMPPHRRQNSNKKSRKAADRFETDA